MKADSVIQLRKRGGATAVTVPRLERATKLRLGFTTRLDGVSQRPYAGGNLSFEVGDDDGAVVENRRWAARLLRVPFKSLTFCSQAHGDEMAVVTKEDCGRGLFSSRQAFIGRDAMVTNLLGITLCILTADCLPLILVDPERRAVGVAHLGWKGTSLKLAVKTVLKLGQEYASKAGDILAILGPAICPQCYEVDDALKEKFSGDDKVFRRIAPRHYSFDLVGANKAQLLEAGVKEENIIDTSLCTAKYLDYFYSHRAEGASTGRQMAAVMLR